jgi:hypothetical protein
MKASSVLILGTISQALGIGAGLLVSASGIPYGPHIGGMVTLVLVGFIFVKALNTVKTPQLLFFIPVWALVYVVTLHAIGFLWFPGFVKDLEPFSAGHLIRVISIFSLILVIYAVELAAMKLLFQKRS